MDRIVTNASDSLAAYTDIATSRTNAIVSCKRTTPPEKNSNYGKDHFATNLSAKMVAIFRTDSAKL